MEYHQPRTPTLSFNAFLRPVPKSETDKPPESGIKSEATLPDSTDKEKTTEQTDQGSTQNDPVQKPDSGEVFKKPLSAKNDDPMQVRIDTSQLKVESHDIEMLSAKSTDGKIEEKPKENQEPGRGHKQLISQDTKALVKAALMNANLRKQRLGMYMYFPLLPPQPNSFFFHVLKLKTRLSTVYMYLTSECFIKRTIVWCGFFYFFKYNFTNPIYEVAARGFAS